VLAPVSAPRSKKRTVNQPALSTEPLVALEAVLRNRLDNPTGSHASRVVHDRELAQRKVMEEAFEFCLEVGRPELDESRVASEAADVVFHLVAALVSAGVPVERVTAELEARRR
jgi:phosphoribosyl-ATP pyrophosphohydrolase